MRKSLIVAVVGLIVAGAFADPLKIIGFETGSGIAFQGATVSNYFTIEFASSPDGPWTNWGSLTDQSITGTVMTAASPMFYRIRQDDSSPFPPYAEREHSHSNILSTMLADGAAQTEKIADEAVTEAKLRDRSVTPAKLAFEAVETAAIDTGAVTSDKLALNSVTAGKILSGAVTENKILASGTLVPNLNADLLDGEHAAAFVRTEDIVAPLKRVIRGSLITSTTSTTIRFSPPAASVNPAKCTVNVRALKPTSALESAGVIVEGLTSTEVTFAIGGSGTFVKIDYEIVEHN